MNNQERMFEKEEKTEHIPLHVLFTPWRKSAEKAESKNLELFSLESREYNETMTSAIHGSI